MCDARLEVQLEVHEGIPLIAVLSYMTKEQPEVPEAKVWHWLTLRRF